MSGIVRTYCLRTSATVKDVAEQIGIASGHDNLFLDAEGNDEKLIAIQEGYEKGSPKFNAVEELRKIINTAYKKDAGYIHLY